jgi:hypothetical protein
MRWGKLKIRAAAKINHLGNKNRFIAKFIFTLENASFFVLKNDICKKNYLIKITKLKKRYNRYFLYIQISVFVCVYFAILLKNVCTFFNEGSIKKIQKMSHNKCDRVANLIASFSNVDSFNK